MCVCVHGGDVWMWSKGLVPWRCLALKFCGEVHVGTRVTGASLAAQRICLVDGDSRENQIL